MAQAIAAAPTAGTADALREAAREMKAVAAAAETQAKETSAAPVKAPQAVLVATHTCPNCGAAKKMLEKAGIAYQVLYADDPEGSAFAEKMGIVQAPTLLMPAAGGTFEKYTNVGEIAGFIKKRAAVTA